MRSNAIRGWETHQKLSDPETPSPIYPTESAELSFIMYCRLQWAKSNTLNNPLHETFIFNPFARRQKRNTREIKKESLLDGWIDDRVRHFWYPFRDFLVSFTDSSIWWNFSVRNCEFMGMLRDVFWSDFPLFADWRFEIWSTEICSLRLFCLFYSIDFIKLSLNGTNISRLVSFAQHPLGGRLCMVSWWGFG